MDKIYNITFGYDENNGQHSYLSFEDIRGMTFEDYCQFCKRFAAVLGFSAATIDSVFDI